MYKFLVLVLCMVSLNAYPTVHAMENDLILDALSTARKSLDTTHVADISRTLSIAEQTILLKYMKDMAVVLQKTEDSILNKEYDLSNRLTRYRIATNLRVIYLKLYNDLLRHYKTQGIVAPSLDYLRFEFITAWDDLYIEFQIPELIEFIMFTVYPTEMSYYYE